MHHELGTVLFPICFYKFTSSTCFIFLTCLILLEEPLSQEIVFIKQLFASPVLKGPREEPEIIRSPLIAHLLLSFEVSVHISILVVEHSAFVVFAGVELI